MVGSAAGAVGSSVAWLRLSWASRDGGLGRTAGDWVGIGSDGHARGRVIVGERFSQGGRVSTRLGQAVDPSILLT